MEYWILTDTHLNHKAAYSHGRPKDFIDRIMTGAALIPEDSIFIHLGDVVVGSQEDFHHQRLLANVRSRSKILVTGNHDQKSYSWYYDVGWDFICEVFQLKFWGKKLVFSHRPLQPPEDTKLLADSLNIHGHTHGNSHRDKEVKDIYDPMWHCELALERTDYQPIKLDPRLWTQRNQWICLKCGKREKTQTSIANLRWLAPNPPVCGDRHGRFTMVEYCSMCGGTRQENGNSCSKCVEERKWYEIG